MAGQLEVGGALIVDSGSKNFKIDDPIDPQNKFLFHACVESDEVKNVYDGMATLDQNGEAVVELPAWFGALNEQYRYQLTAVGAPAPSLHIHSKIANNRFTIAGGSAGLEVSWQVTGVRADPWAKAHRLPPERDKAASERGYYLAPKEYGQPEEKGISYMRRKAREAAQERATPPAK